MFYNNRGNALISVMVAAVIGGIVSAGVGNMLKATMDVERGIASNSDLSQLASIVQMILEKQDTCQFSGLIGVKFPVLPIDPQKAEDDQIAIYLPTIGQQAVLAGIAPKLPVTPIAAKGVQFGKRLITSVSFSELAPLGGGNYFATLRLHTASTGNGITSRKPFRDFHLRVNLDHENKIVACGDELLVNSGNSSNTVTTSEEFKLGNGINYQTSKNIPGNWDFCYLTYTGFEPTNQAHQAASCYVNKQGNQWVLGTTGNTGNIQRDCFAQCVAIR